MINTKEIEPTSLNSSASLTLFDDSANKSWYIQEGNNFVSIDYGFAAVDFLNQLFTLKDKDKFIIFEKRMRDRNAVKNDINATVNKGFRYFLFRNSKYDEFTNYSESELEEIYNTYSWLYNALSYDIDSLQHNLADYLNFSVSDRLHNFTILNNNFQFLLCQVFDYVGLFNMLFDFESVSDKEYLNKISSTVIHDIKQPTDLTLDELEETYCRPSTYLGIRSLAFNNKIIICRKFKPTFFRFIVDDFAKLLLDQEDFSFGFCENCGAMFVSNHKNRKYCPSCAKESVKINNKKRKNNESRYLHKKILDYMNQHCDEAPKEDFRLESNYYYSVVKGKPKEKLKSYTKKIKSESDYYSWLETEFKKIKETNK